MYATEDEGGALLDGEKGHSWHEESWVTKGLNSEICEIEKRRFMDRLLRLRGKPMVTRCIFPGALG